MIRNSMIEMVGNTPMVKLSKVVSEDMADIYVKLEGENPSGSVKIRAALGMILDAEEKGLIKNGSVIVEPTSGNTGIALALIGRMKGYEVVIVMPDTMSIERRDIMEAYGATLLLTDGKLGMKGSIEKANELANNNENYFLPDQFNNYANADFHYKTTGKEILRDLPSIDAFIAGVGTGGTITGVGKALKEHNKDIHVYAVEPEESAVLSGEGPGPHGIQGIGAGFVTGIYASEVVDGIKRVNTDASRAMTKKLFDEEGMFLGISSGANILAALELAKELGKGKKIVVISPDYGEKYISTKVFV